MGSWWHKPSSLNWANKKKLSEKIKQLDDNISHAKKDLLLLLSLVNNLELDCKELSDKSCKQQLAAKHLVDLIPLLEKSEEFKNTLKTLCTKVTTPSIKYE